MNRPPTPPHTPTTTPPPIGGPDPGVTSRIGPIWRRADVVARNEHASSAGDEDFDALTDLFLGETRQSGSGHRSGLADDARAGPTRQTSATPLLRLIRDDRDDDDVVHQEPAPAKTAEQIEEPAGEALWAGLPVPPPARTPVVECVVLGNLPMLAAAWANQHAREVCKATDKPVALLRLQGGYASVELFGAEAGETTLATEPLTLEDAIDLACELTDRWMIRAEPGGESAVLSHPMLRVMTVLTGADQMAREACRVTLRRLAPAISAIDILTGPMVRIGIMGSVEEASAGMSEIAQEARETLGQDTPTFSSAGKIQSGRAARSLYSGPTDHTIAELLDLLERTLMPSVSMMDAEDSAQQDSTADTTPAPNLEEPAPVLVDPVVNEADAALEPLMIAASSTLIEIELPLPEPTPSIAETVAGNQELILSAVDAPTTFDPEAQAPVLEVLATSTAPSATADACPVAAITPDPKPLPVLRSLEVATSSPRQPLPMLAQHLPGLLPLNVQCPYAPSVELATDADGVLHLMAGTQGCASDDAALAELMVASSWSSMHAGLLAAGTGRPLHADRPTLHILTDHPKRSRRLLDTSVRVHLLTRVSVGESTGWCCVELN